MRHAVLRLKTALASDRDRAILAECERGEDAVIAKYRETLQHPLPRYIREMLEGQIEQIVASQRTSIMLNRPFRDDPEPAPVRRLPHDSLPSTSDTYRGRATRLLHIADARRLIDILDRWQGTCALPCGIGAQAAVERILFHASLHDHPVRSCPDSDGLRSQQLPNSRAYLAGGCPSRGLLVSSGCSPCLVRIVRGCCGPGLTGCRDGSFPQGDFVRRNSSRFWRIRSFEGSSAIERPRGTEGPRAAGSAGSRIGCSCTRRWSYFDKSPRG